jgi:hypothetical protein
MSDYQLQEPQLLVPARQEPLAMPPYHYNAPQAPLDIPLPEPPFMERHAMLCAYRNLPEVIPPDPQPQVPPATWRTKYQMGITDDPGLSLALSHRLAHSDWNFAAQLSLSSQSDNPNDTDKTNRLRAGSPLGDVDFTPGGQLTPSDGQSPPLSAAELRDAISRHPHPPANVSVPMTIHRPPDTMCREPR